MKLNRHGTASTSWIEFVSNAMKLSSELQSVVAVEIHQCCHHHHHQQQQQLSHLCHQHRHRLHHQLAAGTLQVAIRMSVVL